MKGYYLIETYGCEMNKAESNALAYELNQLGYLPTTQAGEADWIIINTCSVRQSAEDRVWGRLGYFKALKKDSNLKIALMGCMAEHLKNDEKLFKIFNVDEVIGNFDKKNFIAKLAKDKEQGARNKEQISELGNYFTGNDEYSFFSRHQANGLKAHIPIMHGCNNFCSYCIVPYLRGREISRPPAEIIGEITAQLVAGVKEIVLIGQNVNSYNTVLNFPQLLKEISTAVSGNFRLRFTSSHPKDFSRQLVEVMAGDSRFAPQLHLAAQHGSDKVLAEMNRGYTAAAYLDLLKMAREIIPNIEITTDLLIGFPGETAEDFKLLLQFIKEAGFNDGFTYKYNDRAGTAASKRSDKVADEVAASRLSEVITLQRAISAERLKRRIGQTVTVLVQHQAKRTDDLFGYNEYNENVVFKADNSLVGQFVSVRVKSVSGLTLQGIVEK
ncbi:MAG: tRNA (N6-isopentenyl adenosine(37)-C2)-methylthiotransferase MiaB [Spirochaetaceae bacterium]|nr:tRNA (N6-isopentenyl adenosine(37)-C2)-methylthiotransferase MiaB [Spirochaetaceae bacterium]